MSFLGIKQISENEFESVQLWSIHPSGRAFGGHLVSQALESSLFGEENVGPHSMNVYFHRPVDVSQKMIFKVENLRIGRSLRSKRVTGTQNGKLMLTVEVSFISSTYSSLYYQNVQLNPQLITNLMPINTYIKSLELGIDQEQKIILNQFLNIFDIEIGQTPDRKRIAKYKLKQKFETDKQKYALIGFITDFLLIESSLIHLKLNIFSDKLLFLASIDHKIYFNSVNFENTLIFVSECLIIGQSKVLCMGQLFNEKSEIIATAIQEGMIKFAE